MVSLLHHRDTFSRQIQILVRVTRVPGDTGQGLPGYPEIQEKGYQGTRRYRTRVTRVPGENG